MDQRTEKAPGTLECTKRQMSTVHSGVDGGDIPDLRLKITPRRVQIPRSTKVKPRGAVGEVSKTL